MKIVAVGENKMGYWNNNKPETEGEVWGDAPADIMDDAVAAIVWAFVRDMGRKPTKQEIQTGLRFSLSIFDDDMNVEA
jgi:hypothetical protein